MVRGGRTGWIIAQAMMGWLHVDMLKLKKEVREDSAAARETSRRQKDW
jgi:hypothetical protein